MGDHPSPSVLRLIEASAGAWFPELGAGHADVVVEETICRAQSSISTVRVEAAPGGGGPGRRIIVKQAVGRAVPVERPRLGIGPDDIARKDHWEWRALVIAWETFGTGRYPGLGAVRPLAHVPEERTLVVCRLDDDSLKSQLVSASRLGRGRLRGDLPATFFRLGRWLAAFHRHDGAVHAVRATPGERARVAEDYAAFLRSRHPVAARLAHRLVAVQPDVSPDLPLGLGHGDFAPRNAFIATNGDVKVIDILGRWRVPIYEDIAFLLIELRMAGPELLLFGHAFPAGFRRDLEAAFLHGYSVQRGAAVDEGALAWYGALVVIDKWAAAVTRGPARGRERLRHQLVSRRLTDELTRATTDLRARVS